MTARPGGSQAGGDHFQLDNEPPDMAQIAANAKNSMGFTSSGVSKRTVGESIVSSDADGLRIDT